MLRCYDSGGCGTARCLHVICNLTWDHRHLLYQGLCGYSPAHGRQQPKRVISQFLKQGAEKRRGHCRDITGQEGLLSQNQNLLTDNQEYEARVISKHSRMRWLALLL